MASEKLLERKFVQRIKTAGGIAIKLIAVNFTGLPDRLVLLPRARVCFAEMKSTGKGLSRRQKIVKAFLEKLGFTYWVISTDEQLELFTKTEIG